MVETQSYEEYETKQDYVHNSDVYMEINEGEPSSQH